MDQLLRASESVVLNIAEGARLRGSPRRQQVLDYAIGSALECAASLDIAQRKQWMAQTRLFDSVKRISHQKWFRKICVFPAPHYCQSNWVCRRPGILLIVIVLLLLISGRR